MFEFGAALRQHLFHERTPFYAMNIIHDKDYNTINTVCRINESDVSARDERLPPALYARLSFRDFRAPPKAPGGQQGQQAPPGQRRRRLGTPLGKVSFRRVVVNPTGGRCPNAR